MTLDDKGRTTSSVPTCTITQAMAKQKQTEFHVEEWTDNMCSQSKGKEVNEGDKSGLTCSWQELMMEQSKDSKLQQLCQYALEEPEISTMSRCYFLKQREYS